MMQLAIGMCIVAHIWIFMHFYFAKFFFSSCILVACLIDNSLLTYLQYYSHKNTIMFDDLRRNFVMNPQNGLTIKPFKRCHANRESDQELVKLTQYLLDIARLDDICTLDHKNWESFGNVKRRRHD